MKINPVLRNESRISGRSFRFYLMIMFYIALLAAPILFSYYALTSEAYYYGITPYSFMLLYLTMACVQAGLLMFIVPALSASAITAEREKQTLDILLSTRMSPVSIVVGKLLASTSKVILLIICTVPIYSIGFILGGVSFINIIQLSLYLIVTTLFVGSIGVFISASVKTTRVANVLSLVAVLTLVVGTLIIYAALAFIYLKANPTNMTSNPSLPLWLYLNPAVGFGNLLLNQLGAVGPLEILLNFSNSGSWIVALIIQLVLTVGMIYLAAYKLNPLHGPLRIKNKKNNKKKVS